MYYTSKSTSQYPFEFTKAVKLLGAEDYMYLVLPIRGGLEAHLSSRGCSFYSHFWHSLCWTAELMTVLDLRCRSTSIDVIATSSQASLVLRFYIDSSAPVIIRTVGPPRSRRWRWMPVIRYLLTPTASFTHQLGSSIAFICRSRCSSKTTPCLRASGATNSRTCRWEPWTTSVRLEAD